MDFSGDIGLWQRKVAEGPEGVARRMAVFAALAVRSGQTVLDLGCGGGHLVRELALAVGNAGRAVGLDTSAEQLNAARVLCDGIASAELVQGDALEMSFEDSYFDGIASIQTLEYIPDVDAALAEARRVLKLGAKAAFISVLWDHWRFHGAEPKLNNRILDAWRAHCVHQMLPIEMPQKLAATGFGGAIRQTLAFFNGNLHENAYALWASKFTAAFAIDQGLSEEDVRDWQEQLDRADKEGRFAFVSVPVLTTVTAI